MEISVTQAWKGCIQSV